ncbi:uncharacterized protein MELLADRAFT_95179 [Melampsora larici-populina 98AG31]|uniref:Uncharacterized protein n=1 Tax=Melampsora larici-populina (strain 98AG31 / pathotype 3-4-7) TaxID=747676 RepID=F4RCF3_MELLP|nr:uncharacterized protein MELLADRAFT_95179 [Melampsora larici-populina 98AG31]EGG09722.1 hypothetical protein MELLADRAFT_95179 [Melampsora larici-populina 98AG31]
MDSAPSFRFPAARTPSTVTSTSNGSPPSSPTFLVTPGSTNEAAPKSPTLSTISTIVGRKSFGADGVARMIRRKKSSTSNRYNVPRQVLRAALPVNHSVGWTMSTSPTNKTGISASQSFAALVKTPNDAPRRRGIPRSVTGPLTRFFHLDGKEDDDGNGWDFRCCGEAPQRPERRAPEWLGTMDFEEAVENSAATKTGKMMSGTISASPDALGALGSPWCPDANWGQAWDLAAARFQSGGSPPPSATSGGSPASAEASLASPSSVQIVRHHYLGSPDSSLASPEVISSMYCTPPSRTLTNGFGVSKAGPARRTKISIDSISGPMMKDFRTSASQVSEIRS